MTPGLIALVIMAIAGTLLSATYDMPALLIIPVASVIAMLGIVDYRKLYLLLWASIPISTEVEFGSLGADLPDEVLMIAITGIAILLFIYKSPKLNLKMLLNPISLLLLLHMGWILITTVTSTQPIISLKFFIAKLWYIAPFYFMAYYLMVTESDMRTWLRWLLIPILGTVLVILVRHSGDGFSFMTVNDHLKPFYRNHVDYSFMLGVCLPFVWVLRKTWRGKYTGLLICAVLLLGIYFSYTRAAYIGVVAAVAGYLLIRFKLVKIATAGAVIASIVIIVTLARDNRYIDYAPQYEKTITHYEFENLLEATYKLEDISSMERVYRWVAGFYMMKDRPILGFGPGSFYESYMPYTDEHFVTYVSDNPEHSGMHNYFLMTATDQGLPGLIIFVALVFIGLLKAEWLYHRVDNQYARNIVAASAATLCFIIFVLLLNDMIETDKVGTFFFFCLAMIVSIENRYLHSPDKQMVTDHS